MGNGTPLLTATRRALAMLDAVIADRGTNNVSALGRAAGLPPATAHRQVATLVAEGYLVAVGGGRHLAGPRLRALLPRVDERQLIAALAAPALERLAARTGAVAQLGTLDNDMVTYRIKTGAAAGALFTRIGMQLEAYCSAIGKVLLAQLPARARHAYLASGPFVALTPRTITAPAVLAQELTLVAAQGFGQDCGEIDPALACLAVPLRGPHGSVPSAISISWWTAEPAASGLDRLSMLGEAATTIEREIAAFL